MRGSVLPYVAVMPLALACCTGGDPDIIAGTVPFQNLRCAGDLIEPSQIITRAEKFAAAHDLRHRSNEFSTVIMTDRLNFVLAYPPSAPIYLTGIARSSPTLAEKELFKQFMGSSSLECSPTE